MADGEESIKVTVTSKKKEENPRIKSSSTPIMKKSVDKEDKSSDNNDAIVSRTNKVVSPIDTETSSIKIVKDELSEPSSDDSLDVDTQQEAADVSDTGKAVTPESQEPATQSNEEISASMEDEVSKPEEELSSSTQAQVDSDNDDKEENEDNPLGPTVADLASHTETMDAHDSRDYKITPAKLKKSPTRSRQQKLGIVTTIIVFLGVVAVIVVGLWMFLPGFDETLSNLFA